MKTYKILRCPKCGHLQISGAQNSLKCIKCNKSSVFSSCKIFYRTEDPVMASKTLIKIKEEIAINMGKADEGFRSLDPTL